LVKDLEDPLEPGSSPRSIEPRGRLAGTSLIALGVVFGDIGTSPLYAIRECFHGTDALPVSEPRVLGVLSLVLWSLLLVISLKYLTYMLRASNRGEGGILALTSLLHPSKGEEDEGKEPTRGRAALIALGIFGAALLYADGAITPAISVLSAIEGLEVAARGLDPVVLPLSIAVLAALFIFQRRGTAVVGRIFGPVMLAWFLVIGALGLVELLRNPATLLAVDPTHAFALVHEQGWAAAGVLGAVFLVVTGGEALYADIGHFGVRPIRAAWFFLVLPALLLNYFGQGARRHRESILCARPGLGALSDGPARDGRDDHRLAGRHLGGVLADAAGDPARIPAATRDPTHVP
jgi:KUP system potassium uptake protein